MARREPIDVTLGERSFKIRALTIDQMQKIETELETSRGRKDVLPFATAVLRIALERDHAQEKLGEIECEMPEVSRALQAILRHGGFIQGAAVGEAPAAAAARDGSTGDGFGVASPPALA